MTRKPHPTAHHLTGPRTLAAALVAALGVLGLTACEEKPDTSAADAARAAEQRARQIAELSTRPAVPTTQELVAGPKKTLRLGELPVSMQVPMSWSIKPVGEGTGLLKLNGMASSGELDIQLASTPATIAAERLPIALAAAKKEVEAKPHPINRVDLRSVGRLKVLEQRMISNDFVNGAPPPEVVADVPLFDPALADKLPAGTKMPTTRAVVNPIMVSWRLTVLTPSADGKTYTSRGIAFQALKLSEFMQDRDFLEQLVASLREE